MSEQEIVNLRRLMDGWHQRALEAEEHVYRQRVEVEQLRTLLEMVCEERDTWRWRVIGGDRPVCRHDKLHGQTEP